MNAVAPLDRGDDPAWTNCNSLWGAFFWAAALRLGLRRVVVAPGSRSAPLTFAAARQPGLETAVLPDERGAGFFALGWAAACGEPVALVCTSGTAAANFYPAVIEAAESGVPLIVLTADRPAELRHCRAGQAIDQLRLYGTWPRFQAELPLPEPRPELFRRLRDLLRHALATANGPQPGPVHLNCPFREPLLPESGARLTLDWDPRALLPEAGAPLPGKAGDVPADWRMDGGRGLILAGPDPAGADPGYVAAVARLANKLGWPVLADAASPVRHATDIVPGVIGAYDWFLRAPQQAAGLAPDAVLCLGEPPTSKVLRQWLTAVAPRWTLLRGDGNPVNPLALDGPVIHAGVEQAAARLAAAAPPAAGWPARWLQLEERAQAWLDQRLEPGTVAADAWTFGRHWAATLEPGTPVFLASSLPIRNAEWLWRPNASRAQVQVNRGANGIDGTLSSALGMVRGRGRHGVLLCGDLALLHDSNALATAREAGAALTVLLFNNAGGGIFEFLPPAQWEPPFERFFATPQAIDWAALAAAYGAEHRLLQSLADWRAALAQPPAAGVRICELRGDRRAEAARLRALFAEAAGGSRSRATGHAGACPSADAGEVAS
jgi:2-succinyl-5-enolpyruvyl-6-hydroxy-3-cyclohexene-1-carboxylate synthase